MGIVHKLKPEIQAFILEAKKNKPALGCRSLATLVYEQFQTEVSKSTINALIKTSGLSMPVGRRSKLEHQGKLKSSQALIQTPIKAIIQSAAKAVLDLTPVKEVPSKEPQIPAKEEKTTIQLPPVISQPPVEAPLEIIPQAPVSPEPIVEAPAQPESVVETPVSPPEPVEEVPAQPEPAVEIPAPPEPAAEVMPAAQPEPAEEILAQPAVIFPDHEVEASGALILKAADYLLGGSFYLCELLKNRLGLAVKDLLAKTETLLYDPLCAENLLWSLSGKKFSYDEMSSYLKHLEEATANLSREMFSILENVFQEIRGIQISLAEGEIIYLDGQNHTVWSSPHLPFDLSTTIHQGKKQVHECLEKNQPCILLTAPGYEVPSKEFLDFIYSLEYGRNRMLRATLYNQKTEGVDTLHIEETKKHNFLFGLWPWQYQRYRKIDPAPNFITFHFAPLEQDFFLAETRLELSQPDTEQIVTLRACALKRGLNEKIRLLIVTNFTPEQLSLQSLAQMYLSRWGDPEESFEDFSRKIELFTYTADSRKLFSLESLGSPESAGAEFKNLLSFYLKELELYARWRLLPSGYEEAEFLVVKERFYDLKAKLKEEDSYFRVIFTPPQGYAFLKDLQYICKRLNEREVIFFGKRAWFSL